MPSPAARVSYKRIGDRDQRVVLQSAVITRDRLRGREEEWVEYGREWGAITALPFVVSEQNAAVIYLVEIPWRSDVIVGHRVVTSSQTLKVIAVVNPEERRIALQLHCAQVIV